MKDYTKEIEEIANDYNQVPGMIHLVSIIRKDVEAEIERLKEENESLKSENIRFKKSLMQLQAGEATLPVGKPDSERLWEAMMMIVNAYSSDSSKECWNYSGVVKTAKGLLTAWKEATK